MSLSYGKNALDYLLIEISIFNNVSVIQMDVLNALTQ